MLEWMKTYWLPTTGGCFLDPAIRNPVWLHDDPDSKPRISNHSQDLGLLRNNPVVLFDRPLA